MSDDFRSAVIYARFSSSKQREASIEDQLRICHEWCASRGIRVIGEYCDRAASGRTDDRPEFQRMIANAGESDIVLVYMMDRFSRDIYDAPIYKKRLRDKGVRVVSATESMPDGPESMLMESIYEAMAAMESAHISQRTSRGMEGNALKCMHNGVRVFGYRFGDDGRYAVDEGEAEIVREVFNRRLSGEAPNSIAQDLASRGVVTSHGKPCSHAMVASMLKNEKYIGVYSWGGTRVEGGMPSIVDEETFMKAQRVVSKKVRGTEEWGDFAFAGRGVCMECGMNLVGTSGRGYNGTKYSYYRCGHKCGCKAVRADWLEDAVVAEIRHMLSQRETALQIAMDITDGITDEVAERRLEAARKARADAERAIANIMRAIEDGMPYADVADRLSELRLNEARAKADERAWTERSTIDTEDFAKFLQFGATLDDRALLDAFVYQVLLGHDSVVVILNYDTDGEPARIEWSRIKEKCEPQKEFALDKFGSPDMKICERSYMLVEGMVALVFSRAA